MAAEVKAQQMPPTGSGRKKKAQKWRFYESMLFMKDTLVPKKAYARNASAVLETQL